jgi:hypothetical protein
LEFAEGWTDDHPEPGGGGPLAVGGGGG